MQPGHVGLVPFERSQARLLMALSGCTRYKNCQLDEPTRKADVASDQRTTQSRVPVVIEKK